MNPKSEFFANLTRCALLGLCLASTYGYVIILDEHAEDPSLPGMCVPEPQRWDRIVPVGFSYPVARDCYADITGDSASRLPPCEQVSCTKTTSRHGRNVFTLQITGCENTAYTTNHDPTCDLFIPDQRLPFPLCCPQRTCYYSNNNNPFIDVFRNKRPFADPVVQNNFLVDPIKRQEVGNKIQQRSASSSAVTVQPNVTGTALNPQQSSNPSSVVHVPLFALPPFTHLGRK